MHILIYTPFDIFCQCFLTFLLQVLPGESKFAPIEKVLVDIYFESEALALMDRGEFERMAENVIRSARVSVPTVIAYSDERQVPILKLFTE